MLKPLKSQQAMTFAAICCLLLASTREAAACGICVTKAADSLLPPLPLWCGIAVVWYLGMAFLSSHYSEKIKGIPNFVWALAIFLLCLLFGVGTIGLVAFLPLGIAANVAFARALRTDNPGNYSPHLRTSIGRLGFTILLTAVVASLLSVKIQHERTPTNSALRRSENTSPNQ